MLLPMACCAAQPVGDAHRRMRASARVCRGMLSGTLHMPAGMSLLVGLCSAPGLLACQSLI